MPRRELPKVPPAAREALDAALRAEGLEVTKSAVRVPAETQLLGLLEAEQPLDERGVAARLALVTAPEAKALVVRLVREGKIRRVERPHGTGLALPAAGALSEARAALLRKELERALAWVKRAMRVVKGGQGERAALLERDVAALLERLAALSREAERTPPSALLDRLARAAVELAAQHGGLAPMATLVRAIGAPTSQVHAALLEGHARGWFELQPESSMGRLRAEDVALCLPGPQGTRLSWVRPLARNPEVLP